MYNFNDFFNDLIFEEKTHTYRVGEKELISVTTFLKRYVKPFNAPFIAKMVSLSKIKKGNYVSPEYLETYWRLNAEAAAAKGTLVHWYAESIPNLDTPNSLLEWAVYNFYYDVIFNKEEVVEKELKTYFGGLAGTVDLITRDSEGIIMRDYKTTKDLYKSYGKMLGVFSDFKDNKLNQYTLQMLIYSFILEEATGVTPYKREIVQLTEDGYKIIPTNTELELLFNDLIINDNIFRNNLIKPV